MIPHLLWKRTLFRRLFPNKLNVQAPYIWVHAVSVGEVTAAIPVVEELRRIHPSWDVVISTITEAGFECAQKSMPNGTVLLLPFDFRWSLKRVLSILPVLVVVSEGDIWPIFLQEAKRGGAPVVVTSGKLSQKSFRRLRYFGRWLFSCVNLFCVQGRVFADRFRSLGVPAEDIFVTGNTKVDVRLSRLSPEELAGWRSRLKIHEGEHLIVLASSHEPEEELLVQKLLPVVGGRAKIAVVPRHPRRFEDVYRKLQELEPLTAKFSAPVFDCWKIMVVDSMGVLQDLYQLATVAIVCGSFVPSVGGHNIVEPAAAGVPVVVGPYMQSQALLCESAREEGAITQIDMDFLDESIIRLLEDASLRERYAQAARRWAEGLKGATQKTVAAIEREIGRDLKKVKG